MTTEPFFIEKDGNKTGPLSRDDLESHVSAGELSTDTLVWQSGMADWTPARDVGELAELVPAWKNTPPPLPRKSSSTDQIPGQPAALWRRFIANFIDGAVTMVITAVVGGTLQISPDAAIILLFLVASVYYLSLMSDVGGGKSLGYMATRIRLVKYDENSPPSIGKVLLWLLVLCLAGLVGWIWYFNNRERKMLHNLVV